jgi:DNA-binding transcriptional LysR family regulator
MDIRALTYFKKIAELQHVTQASEILHVAQPSLSRTVSNLEAELGVPLFKHIGKRIVLNRYGEILLEHTNRVLRELEAAEGAILHEKGEADRLVRISIFAASKLLPKLVMDFKKEYPSIRLKIIQEDLGTNNDDWDLSIRSSMRPEDVENSTLLLEEEIFLALPESNPLSHSDSVTLGDVADEDFICLQKGKGLRSITDLYCKMAGFEPKVVLESDSPDIVREFILSGVGISFVPAITWKGVVSEQIVLMPVSFPECKRYIHLVWREYGRLSPVASLFRDYIKNYFAALPR